MLIALDRQKDRLRAYGWGLRAIWVVLAIWLACSIGEQAGDKQFQWYGHGPLIEYETNIARMVILL